MADQSNIIQIDSLEVEALFDMEVLNTLNGQGIFMSVRVDDLKLMERLVLAYGGYDNLMKRFDELKDHRV